MLNISENSINQFVNKKESIAFKSLRKTRVHKIPIYIFTGFIVTVLLSSFLPWTQNIQAKGFVTTRQPDQRPQAVQAIISGRIESWFAKEGDFVNTGDTLALISEIKSEYFDPRLIERTSEQIDAKELSVDSYQQKYNALKNQYSALQNTEQLKLNQTENKVLQAQNKINIDSIDLMVMKANLEIAQNQLNRIEELHKKGLKSLSELQEKELKFQQSSAKLNAQENKLIIQRNQFENLKIELAAIRQEYADKLSKSVSEQQSAISDKMQSLAEMTKLETQLSNYNQRQEFYHIKAPQSGYVTQAIAKGIGEIIKEGDALVTIMPEKYDLAVEVYLKPQDLPLISMGNKANLRFDGWPAIIISGWPEGSTGIFEGEIASIDRFISSNGKYRVLISPSDSEKKWPKDLRVGTGIQSFILLKNVPIWYEVWRQLNGFPADFYVEGEQQLKDDYETKLPAKSIK